MRSSSHGPADSCELLKHPLIREKLLDASEVGDALEKLIAHRGVRRIRLDGGVTEKYHLVHEFVNG